MSETPSSKFGPYFEHLESELVILKLPFRRDQCYSNELYYGVVLGDRFLLSFPSNFVTANGTSDSFQTTTQWCNSTRHQTIFIRNVRMTSPRGVRSIMAHTGQKPGYEIYLFNYMKGEGNLSIRAVKGLKSWLLDAYWAVKRTRKPPWLSDLLILKRRCKKRYMKRVPFL